VQEPDAAVRKKGSTETAAAVRKKGSADRSYQPREPATVAGRAITAKKGSKDKDIESGLLVSASGMVDEQTESARLGGTTITTQIAEMSAFPTPTMHTPSPNILTSKAAIANRTAAVEGKARKNGAASVTDGALPITDKSLDKDESGALSEAAEEPPARAMMVTAYTVDEVDQEANLYKTRLAIEADVRRQMRTEVVDAEIVEEPKIDQPRRRRGRLQFLLLALVAIVAAVVGGVVGSQRGEGELYFL
jgi:hypothetical protein